MLNAVFLDAATFGDDADFSALTNLPLSWQFHAVTSPAEVVERCQDCEVVISNKVVLNADTLAQLPKLKFIGVAATGMNNIDLAAAEKHGIKVQNVSGYAGTSLAQHVFALLTLVTNQLHKYAEDNRSQGDKNWSQSPHFCRLDYPIRELGSLTLGIVGGGVLGSTVAKVADALGMTVIYAGRKGERQVADNRVPWDDFLAKADVISLHCPLTADNAKLFSTAEFAAMKNDAIFINTARGGLVDEAALLEALDKGDIAAACLDVLSVEPPPKDHILLANPRPNLYISPHNAWASRAARQRLLGILAGHIKAFLN